MDTRQLMHRCLSPVSAYHQEGEVVTTKDGVYIYKDNKSLVLAVAHLDTVNMTKHFRIRENRGIIRCGQLDDRLGAHVILDVLPSMGIVTDILLTEGEETGKSTAAYFKTSKKYNWIFSFDRRGDDVVGYQFEDNYWREKIKTAGFREGAGSFSDIAKLYGLGCKGFNVGVGYHDEHSHNAHLVIKQLERQLKKFQMFHTMHQFTHMPHTKTVVQQQGGYSYWDGTRYVNGYDTNMLSAEILLEVDPDVLITISGYKDITMPLSRALEFMAPYELKNLVKDTSLKTKVSKSNIGKYLIETIDHGQLEEEFLRGLNAS